MEMILLNVKGFMFKALSTRKFPSNRKPTHNHLSGLMNMRGTIMEFLLMMQFGEIANSYKKITNSNSHQQPA